MNRRQVIELALKKAEIFNSPDFLSTARILLNLTIKRLNREYEWYQYRMETSIYVLPGLQDYSLPSDYLRHESVKLYGDKVPLQQKTKEETDRMYNMNDIPIRKPNYYFIDQRPQPAIDINRVVDNLDLRKKILFDSIPDKAYVATLLYYFELPEVSTDDSISYDNSICPFEDYILVEALASQLYDYMGDDRAGDQWQKVDYIIRQLLMNNYDMDGKQDTIPLNREFFK